MCRILKPTMTYSGCPASCNKTSEMVISDGCEKYMTTGKECPESESKVEYSGQSTSRSQCDSHKDEGYSDNYTR